MSVGLFGAGGEIFRLWNNYAVDGYGVWGVCGMHGPQQQREAMTTVPSCASCKWCHLPTDSTNINDGHCEVVVDPFSGSAIPVKQARQDTWSGFNLPCGYAGALWQAK